MTGEKQRRKGKRGCESVWSPRVHMVNPKKDPKGEGALCRGGGGEGGEKRFHYKSSRSRKDIL